MEVFLIFPKSPQAKQELARELAKFQSGQVLKKCPEAALLHGAEAGTGRRSREAPESAEVIHRPFCPKKVHGFFRHLNRHLFRCDSIAFSMHRLAYVANRIPFVGAERVHRLDEPDGTDRDQILLVIRLGVVLFEDAFLKANLPRS